MRLDRILFGVFVAGLAGLLMGCSEPVAREIARYEMYWGRRHHGQVRVYEKGNKRYTRIFPPGYKDPEPPKPIIALAETEYNLHPKKNKFPITYREYLQRHSQDEKKPRVEITGIEPIE